MTRVMLMSLVAGSLVSLATGCSDDPTAPDATTQPDAMGEPDAMDTSCMFKPDGTPCGSQSDSDCDHPDMCISGYCYANFEVAGRQCGDAANSECDRPDTCDGAGACNPNYLLAGTPCGDEVDNQCTDPDTCDGSGMCAENNELDGLTCDECTRGSELCNGCEAGVCSNICNAIGLSTTFMHDSGNYGVMFEVHAINQVHIRSFDINIVDGFWPVGIFYRAGPYAGYENNELAWTELGTLNVGSNGPGGMTPVMLDLDVLIPAGETYSFYIVLPEASILYTNGTSAGSVYAVDDNVEILEGAGIAGFFGEVTEPVIWNGTVHYDFPPCPGAGVPDAGVPDAAVPDAAVPDAMADAAVPDADMPDADMPDADTPDADTPDATVPDAAMPDAAVPDAAVPDAAVPDAAMPDADMPDAAVPDAAMPDAAVPDAAVPDAAVPDAAVPDAAVPDAAVPDASTAD